MKTQTLGTRYLGSCYLVSCPPAAEGSDESKSPLLRDMTSRRRTPDEPGRTGQAKYAFVIDLIGQIWHAVSAIAKPVGRV